MTHVLIEQFPILIPLTIPSRLLRKFLTIPAQNISFINDEHVRIIFLKEKKQQSSIRKISSIACLQFLYLNGDASFIWFTYSFYFIYQYMRPKNYKFSRVYMIFFCFRSAHSSYRSCCNHTARILYSCVLFSF